ncbi:MAG: hypothetical protein ACQETE_05635 [Bacteroidota bacterium]
MKRLWISALAVCLIAPLAFGQVLNGHRTDAISANGVKQLLIEIEHGFTIEIEGADTDSISYSYTFRGNGLTYNQQFKDAEIQLERSGPKARFSITFPSLKNYNGNGNFLERFFHRLFGGETYKLEIEEQLLTIRVPKELSIESHTQFSDLSIINLEGDHQINNRSGAINIENSQGNLYVENAFGNTAISNFKGDVTVSGPSADIKLHNIEGNVDSDGAFSEQNIRSISGDLAVQNRSGRIDVYEVQGHARINSSFCDLNLKNIKGWVSVTNRSGNLSITDIHDHVTIDGAFVDVEINNVEGDLQAENRSGSFKAANVNGAVLFKGSYADFDLVGYQGDKLMLINRSGHIRVQAMKPLSHVNIENQFDDVDLVMAEKFEGQVHLESTFGSIQTNLPIQMKGYNSETKELQNGDLVKGLVGSTDKGNMQVVVENGSLNIQSEGIEL